MAIRPSEAAAALKAFNERFPKGNNPQDTFPLKAADKRRLEAIGEALNRKAEVLRVQAVVCEDAAAYLGTVLSDFVGEDGLMDADGMGWCCAALEDMQTSGIAPDPADALGEALVYIGGLIPSFRSAGEWSEGESIMVGRLGRAQRAYRKSDHIKVSPARVR